MNVYHQVLSRLYDATGGDGRRAVNLADVIRKERFGGAIETIWEYLGMQGWIADAGKDEFVYITVWGIEEVRRIRSETGVVAVRDAAGDARNAAGMARALSEMLEEYSAHISSPDNSRKARKALESALSHLERLEEAVHSLAKD